MKNFIFVICASIIALIGTVCCSSTHYVTEVASYSRPATGVRILPPDTMTIYQIDSMVAADNLPAYRKWKQTVFRDDDALRGVTYKVLVDRKTNITYTIKQDPKHYILFKKIVSFD